MAEVLEVAETVNYFKTWKRSFDEPKPEFGFFANDVGVAWEDATMEVSRVAKKAQRSAVIRRAQAKRDAGG